MIPKELQKLTPMQGKDRLGAFRDSEYLGAEDIEPGTEPILTIAALYNGMITLTHGKERHDVITFVEEKVPGSINQVRPLVVNATNRKTLRKIYNAVTADALVGKKIKLFLQPDVRDPSTGDKVDGIRIRPEEPKGAKPKPAPKCEVCGKVVTGMGDFTADQIAANTKKKYGKCLCVECGQKAKADAEKQAYEAAIANAEDPVSEEKPADDLASQLMQDAQ